MWGFYFCGRQIGMHLPFAATKFFETFQLHLITTTSSLLTATISHMRIRDRITPEQLDLYLSHRITSKELAKLLGCHPQSLRRAIRRPKKPNIAKEKSILRKMRTEFHKTLAHLPLREIMEKAHVSKTTAWRIQKRYRDA